MSGLHFIIYSIEILHNREGWPAYCIHTAHTPQALNVYCGFMDSCDSLQKYILACRIIWLTGVSLGASNSIKYALARDSNSPGGKPVISLWFEARASGVPSREHQGEEDGHQHLPGVIE